MWCRGIVMQNGPLSSGLQCFSAQLLLLGRTKVFGITGDWHKYMGCHTTGMHKAIDFHTAVVRVGIPFWSHKQIGKSASEGVLRWFYIIIRQRVCSKDPESHRFDIKNLSP